MSNSLGVFGQIPKSNFSINLYTGVSRSKVQIKNPLWLQTNNNGLQGNSDAYGLEFNQRVFRAFWIGTGMEINRRLYAFDRIDPYNKNINIESFVRKDLNQELSIKAEYFVPFRKLTFSGLGRIVANIWLNSKSVITQNGVIYTKNESSFLAGGYRNRIEYGCSISRPVGKQKRWVLRVEPTYSYFPDMRKSQIVDKMNIKSFSLNYGIVRYFKPILLK